MRQQEHQRKFSSGEGWSSREKQTVKNLLRYQKNKGHEALHQQEHGHEEQTAQQQRETDQRLRVEARRLAAQTSTQMHASAQMNELDRNQIQEFAIKVGEAIDAEKHIFPEAGEEIRRHENASYSLSTTLRVSCIRRVWNLLPNIPILRQLKLISKDDYTLPRWSVGITSVRRIQERVPILFQIGIAGKIMNLFWLLKYGNENNSIINK